MTKTLKKTSSDLEQLKWWITTSKSLEERKRLSILAKSMLSKNELHQLNLHIVDFLSNDYDFKRIIKEQPRLTLYKRKKDIFYVHNNLKDIKI